MAMGASPPALSRHQQPVALAGFYGFSTEKP
jgi:hypothetical protein